MHLIILYRFIILLFVWPKSNPDKSGPLLAVPNLVQHLNNQNLMKLINSLLDLTQIKSNTIEQVSKDYLFKMSLKLNPILK